MKEIDFIQSICEEFTDIIITDRKKNTVIFHCPSKYYNTLNKRLTEKSYELTFKKRTTKGFFTCSYTKDSRKNKN
jgi:hypothetical protein